MRNLLKAILTLCILLVSMPHALCACCRQRVETPAPEVCTQCKMYDTDSSEKQPAPCQCDTCKVQLATQPVVLITVSSPEEHGRFVAPAATLVHSPTPFSSTLARAGPSLSETTGGLSIPILLGHLLF